MHLVMLLCVEVDDNDDMVCLKMDNKGVKEIWDTFKIPFRMVNTKENFKDP